MLIVMLGPPGAGKGTIAQRLKTDFGLTPVAAGDLYRTEIQAQTKLGKLAQSIIDKGNIMPDEITNSLMLPYFKKQIILDGYPRNMAQAVFLDEHAKVDHVIFIQIPDELVISRIRGRRTCPACGHTFHIVTNPSKKPGICDFDGSKLSHRADETSAIVSHRIKVYHEVTKPLVAYYRKKGLLRTVDGAGTINEVYARVSKALGVGQAAATQKAVKTKKTAV